MTEASIEARPLFNPFPGLRPFEADEEHLFFGREKEVDELLRRLRRTRFLLIVGSSGTGKSSLVRSGLIPALQGGAMLNAGSSWRIMVFRPGDDPIRNLAEVMDAPGLLGSDGELASTNRVLLEATLQRSSLGIVQAVRQAHIPAQDNILIVVDQFEEIFRFRRANEKSREQAVAFFRLLLESTRQQDIPIYVVLTMRSDFLGDCIEFQGLPEAVNDGLYLIPRMTRDEVRSAITGPVAVAGGRITQGLVQRLLNDLADNQDQLPVLQHALMRTWDHWQRRGEEDTDGIDFADYEAIGGLQAALSLHAEEAYEEATSAVDGQITERVFKALTDTYSDPRGVRRAASILELAAICECPEAEVAQVVEIFRRPGRSFLTPYEGVALGSQTIVDLSHESLMRCWTRLMTWTKEERESAARYIRIAQAAGWWAESSAGLWNDPQLEIGLEWRQENQPSAAWAERYDSHFALAMDFLDRSAAQREAERRNEAARRRNLLYVGGVTLLIFASATYFSFQQKGIADSSRNLAMKVLSVLSNAGAQQSQEFPDSPDLVEFKSLLLEKSKGYYQELATQESGNESVRAARATAFAYGGDIDRLRQKDQEAVDEYNEAIAQYQKLSSEYPKNVSYREKQAYCYMWLGETLRQWLASASKPEQYTFADAEKDYDQAIAIQQKLLEADPANRLYQQELARSYYNRGIVLHAEKTDPTPDFLRSIALLQPLVGADAGSSNQSTTGDLDPAEDLSRAESNLGTVYLDRQEFEQAEKLFRQALLYMDSLQRKDPSNRTYQTEAAYYYSNLAIALAYERNIPAAKAANDHALQLLQELNQPSPALNDLWGKIESLANWLKQKQPAKQ